MTLHSHTSKQADSPNAAMSQDMRQNLEILKGSPLRSEQESRKLDKCGAVLQFLLQWYSREKVQQNRCQRRMVTHPTQRGVG